MSDEWLNVLLDKTESYIERGYSLDMAMNEAWVKSYGGIIDDNEKWGEV